MGIAYELAEFAHQTKAIPASTRTAARRAVFDLIGSAIAGYETPGGKAARQAALAAWGAGEAACWFSGQRLAVPGAAFANAAMASMLDLDDGHRAAIGHPGAPTIPAVLATVERLKLDAERALTAIAIGYEVGVRIAAARTLDKPALDSFATGLWCGQGIAAAVGWLRGLAPPMIAQAIAIAGTSAPNQAATAYTRIMGNNVKEGIAWATATGLTAVDLASFGFTGPVDLLDNPRRYSEEKLRRGLGETWLIETAYFKPYGCCRWIHAPIDAMLELQSDGLLAASDIISIDVDTFAATIALNNECAPPTIESAQYSAPFCVALAALRGPQALLPLEASALGDSAVIALARRVQLHLDPRLEAMFPAAVPARVTVVAGRAAPVAKFVMEPKGEPGNPMSWADLSAKFRGIATRFISPEAADAIERSVAALERGDIAPLLAALARPKDAARPRAEPRPAAEQAGTSML